MPYGILDALNNAFACVVRDETVAGNNIATQAQLQKAAEAVNMTVVEGCFTMLNFLRRVQLCPYDVGSDDSDITNSMGMLETNATDLELQAFKKELCKYKYDDLEELLKIGLIIVAGLAVFALLSCLLFKAFNNKSCPQFFSRKRNADLTTETPLIQGASSGFSRTNV